MSNAHSDSGRANGTYREEVLRNIALQRLEELRYEQVTHSDGTSSRRWTRDDVAAFEKAVEVAANPQEGRDALEEVVKERQDEMDERARNEFKQSLRWRAAAVVALLVFVSGLLYYFPTILEHSIRSIGNP